MEEIVLKIKGMKCTGCSQRVERAMENTTGIEDAIVNLETREAKIKYNKNTITIQEICDTIKDIGFEVEK